MTIKESYDVAGLPTTWGVPTYKNNVATRNAVAVDRLLGAGVVIFGKTNVPLFLADWQSFNAIYGTTNNPWDVTRAPGGSSGGSAAALAAGLTALEAGSDIGSSIRNPAHFCGVYGHKPTWGIVPRTGQALPWQKAPVDIDVVGPLARSADDLALALGVMAGPDDIEAAGWTLKLRPPRQKRLRDFRVALMLEAPGFPVAGVVAFPHDQESERYERTVTVNGKRLPVTDHLFWAGYTGVAYLPSTAAPCGFTPAGLPVGVQIVGPQYGDLTTLAFARLLEHEFQGFVPPPAFA